MPYDSLFFTYYMQERLLCWLTQVCLCNSQVFKSELLAQVMLKFLADTKEIGTISR